MSDLIFYHHPFSRARTVHWLLEELAVPYELKLTRFDRGEHKSPEFLAINPMGKLPAIVHRGEVVTESGAICTYLADAFPAAGLAPVIDDPDRGAYLRWMFYTAACVDSAMADRIIERPPTEHPGRLGYGSFEDVMNTLQQLLGERRHVLGERFSAADVYLGSAIGWGYMAKVLEANPVFDAYLEHLRERPAFKRSAEANAALAAELQGK